MAPRVVVYTSFVAGSLKVRKEQTRILDLLSAFQVEFQVVDISTDEKAKNYMRAKSGKTTFPQIFVDGQYKGMCEDLDEANEHGDIVKWLGLDQPPDEDI